MNLDFYKNKSVFVTGHTGFKGAWLCHVLKLAGAHVTGYALEAECGSVFDVAGVAGGMDSVISDIRDYCALSSAFERVLPEVVFHLAAQPLVLDSYSRPVYTFETNVLGTVNLLECVRQSKSVRSVVIITTDKVYKNNEWVFGYREIDELGGSDPYSASKSCAEIAAESYTKSFLIERNIPLSTARAGNVIGGGDISEFRIIPDCVRAVISGKPVVVRNPYSVRPYQHVLEPLFAYLLIAERQCGDFKLAGSYNIGPVDDDCVTTGDLANVFCDAWGDGSVWKSMGEQTSAPLETNLLRLDCSKIRAILGWHPVWNVKEAVVKVIEWEKARCCGGNIQAVMDKQIEEYLERINNGSNDGSNEK